MFTHREGTGLEGLKPMRMGELSGFGLLREATHVDVERRTAPDGKPCFVLTVWQGRPWRELWVDAETHELRACVFMQGDDVHTELYMHTRFDQPIDAAIFEGGEVGLEKLKQWIAERESAPTN